MNKLTFVVGAGIVFSTFALIGCSGGGGSDGGGGGGGGGPTTQSVCLPPSSDFNGISSNQITQIFNNLATARVTNSGNLVFTYTGTFADFNSLEWNWSNWTAKEIDPGANYTSYSGSPQIFDFDGQLQFILTGQGPSLTPATRLYSETSTSYSSPSIVSGFGSLGNYSIYANDSLGIAGFSVPNFFGSPNYLYYYSNNTAGDFTSWSDQAVDTSATAFFDGLKTGFFTDNTPFVVGYTVDTNTSSFNLYRRSGSTWTNILTIYSLNTSTGKAIYNPEVEMRGQKLLVVWTEYTPAVGPNSAQNVARAVWVDLSAQTTSAPVNLYTVSPITFANEVLVKADISPDSSQSAFAVVDSTKGEMWLGGSNGSSFVAPVAYRPDLNFNYSQAVLLKYGNCSAPLLMAMPSTGASSSVISFLTPNQYGL